MGAGDEPTEVPRTRPELATMLATEHWSLLGTRSMTWSEIMSRISILLTVMSAFLVVLALVAQGVGFDRSLLGVGIGFAAASLVVGSLTALRVALASQEDAQLIRAMNRLRAAYVELAPEIVDPTTEKTPQGLVVPIPTALLMTPPNPSDCEYMVRNGLPSSCAL